MAVLRKRNGPGLGLCQHFLACHTLSSAGEWGPHLVVHSPNMDDELEDLFAEIGLDGLDDDVPGDNNSANLDIDDLDAFLAGDDDSFFSKPTTKPTKPATAKSPVTAASSKPAVTKSAAAPTQPVAAKPRTTQSDDDVFDFMDAIDSELQPSSVGQKKKPKPKTNPRTKRSKKPSVLVLPPESPTSPDATIDAFLAEDDSPKKESLFSPLSDLPESPAPPSRPRRQPKNKKSIAVSAAVVEEQSDVFDDIDFDAPARKSEPEPTDDFFSGFDAAEEDESAWGSASLDLDISSPKKVPVISAEKSPPATTGLPPSPSHMSVLCTLALKFVRASLGVWFKLV